jgi:hypothetical protein
MSRRLCGSRPLNGEARESIREVIDSDDYLPLPSKFDIHEYHIMEDFCYSVEDNKIRDSGAFRRFKDAIQVNGIEEDWYSFRQEALEKITIDWLEDNKVSYTKDEDPGGTQ